MDLDASVVYIIDLHFPFYNCFSDSEREWSFEYAACLHQLALSLHSKKSKCDALQVLGQCIDLRWVSY